MTWPLAFYGVSNLQQPPSTNHYAGRDCNGCHGPNNWSNAQNRKTAAAPATTKSTVDIVANPGIARRSVNSGVLSQSGLQLRGGRVLGGGIAGSAALATGATSMPGITRVNHAGVIANCVSCHNGVLATGTGPLHIASTCENCHTTLAWMPAHFDHRGVTATCVSRHNGVAATAKQIRQIGRDHGAIVVKFENLCDSDISMRIAYFSWSACFQALGRQVRMESESSTIRPGRVGNRIRRSRGRSARGRTEFRMRCLASAIRPRFRSRATEIVRRTPRG